MKLNAFRIKNFRRLKEVLIDLEDDISIFVGANNSGKTSAAQILDIFVNGAKEKLSIFDFSSDCWSDFTAFGENGPTDDLQALPSISVDLWFEVAGLDLGRVMQLLPNIEWEGTEVGLRLSFLPKSTEELLQHFRDAKLKADRYAMPDGEVENYKPWPSTLVTYLEREINAEYQFSYYALDRAEFDEGYKERHECTPKFLDVALGKSILKSMLRVDCLKAQRHLSDPHAGDRAEDLSKCLSRFYKRNLEKRDEDHDALKALSTSEQQLNAHLAQVFGGTLDRIKELGYPGFNNPTLIIKSALNPTTIMTQDTKVHYVLGDDAEVSLPDSYNGLGFKNLIYMVVEILDLQNRWIEEDENRAALHLIFIEEPEAHLHAQLQQVFINKVLGLLQIEDDDVEAYKSQVVITTHSSHILYERGFKPIRYFRRESNAGVGQASSCINLSQFYRQETAHRDFLAKYLKLTHCDLFFADAAILVEGNVERLLIPLMIKQVAPELQSCYLSILEVNGAFAYQFKSLIEFLGIATLVITDIDSVFPPAERPAVPEGQEVQPEPAAEIEEEDDDDDEEEPAGNVPGKKCIVSEPGAHTSNLTLKTWLPGKNTIAELWAATEDECVQEANADTRAIIRVAYQKPQPIVFNAANGDVAGRTFEEAFALENADWTQNVAQKILKLKVTGRPANIDELAAKLHRKISSKSFDKTAFALGLLTKNEDDWTTPIYIRDGLFWLRDRIVVQPEPAAVENVEVNDPVGAEVVA